MWLFCLAWTTGLSKNFSVRLEELFLKMQHICKRKIAACVDFHTGLNCWFVKTITVKVNSSTSCSCLSWDISSYCAGVSPQKLSVSVAWQWIGEDSLVHLKAKDTTLMGFRTEKCVCACVYLHTLFLPLYYLWFYQRSYNSVEHPLPWEVFWMCFKPPQTYRRCSTNKTSLECNYREKTQQFLSITLSSLCTLCLGKPAAKCHTPWEAISQARDRGEVAVGTLTLNFLSLRRLKSQSSHPISILLVHAEHGLGKWGVSNGKGMVLGK